MHMQTGKIATVFGGTGFLGRLVVKKLAEQGVLVRVVTRVPEKIYDMKMCGAVGQIVPVRCDYSDIYNVREIVHGSEYVINCIGILHEKGKKGSFKRSHVDIPAMIAKVCADENVSRLVHISALGCFGGVSRYYKTKLEGQDVVLANFPKAVIIQPSIIFGHDDKFFNMFAKMASYAPFFPLIGGGQTKFQPVYVGDVAEVVLVALMSGSDKYNGKVYQIGGSEVVSFKEIYEILFNQIGCDKHLVNMPYRIARVFAWFSGLMPNPVITSDQVDSLKTDNVVKEGALNISAFGISTKSMDLILPEYLGIYRKSAGY